MMDDKLKFMAQVLVDNLTTDEDIKELNNMLMKKLSQLSSQNLQTLNLFDKVKFLGGQRLYLGTIIKFNRKTALVEVHERDGQKHNAKYKVSLSLLQKI